MNKGLTIEDNGQTIIIPADQTDKVNLDLLRRLTFRITTLLYHMSHNGAICVAFVKEDGVTFYRATFGRHEHQIDMQTVFHPWANLGASHYQSQQTQAPENTPLLLEPAAV